MLLRLPLQWIPSHSGRFQGMYSQLSQIINKLFDFGERLIVLKKHRAI